MTISVVGVDVGGTSIRAVRFDPLLVRAASVSLPTPPVDFAMNDKGDALVSWERGGTLGEASYLPAG